MNGNNNSEYFNFPFDQEFINEICREVTKNLSHKSMQSKPFNIKEVTFLYSLSKLNNTTVNIILNNTSYQTLIKNMIKKAYKKVLFEKFITN